ncbi:putative histidine kinase [Azospirillaceae bacterium]
MPLRAQPVPAGGLTAAFAGLQLAVLERLAHDGDAATRGDMTRIEDSRTQLGALLTSPDAEEGRQALAAYGEGISRILELRQRRDGLMESVLQPVSVQIRLRLQRLIDGARPWSGAVASDAVVGMLLMHQSAVRFVEHHDPREIGLARQELAAARRRLAELGSLLKDAPTREALNEVSTLFDSYEVTLGRVIEISDDEARLSREVLPRLAETLRTRLEALDARPSSSPTPVLAPSAVLGAEVPASETPPPQPLPVQLSTAGSGGKLWLAGLGGALAALALLAVVRWMRQRRPAAAVVSAVVPAQPLQPQAGDEGEAAAALAVDWATTMGRAMLLLQTTGSELNRVRQHSAAIQRELQEARDRAESANRAMASFLDRVGDHLSAPLEAMVRRGDTLMTALERAGATELAADLEALQWSGEQLLRLSEGLRDIARIEAGTLRLDIEDFRLDHLLADLRERIRPQLELYGTTLEILQAGDVAEGPARTDYGRLRTALVHLLENACRFGEGKPVALEAAWLAAGDRQPAQLRFTVSDQGPGISPDRRERIFELFIGFGGEASGATGAGLGLALVRQFAELLGGAITVDSAPGQGASFTLTLPAVWQPSVDGDILLPPVRAALPDTRTTAAPEAAAVGETVA